jgi:hypothetical protein
MAKRDIKSIVSGGGKAKTLLEQLADGDFDKATPAERLEQAKRYNAGMAGGDAKTVIQHYNKSLTVTNQHRISEFYKPSKVKQALQAVNVSDDLADIKSKLLANINAVKAFYELYKDDYLSETISHTLPKQGTKEFNHLARHLEQNGTIWMLKTNESQERIKELLGSGKVKELEQAISTDKHREQLLKELEALPTGKTYGFNTASEELTPDSVAPTMQGVYDLAEQAGIKPAGDVLITVTYGDEDARQLRQSHYNIRLLLSETLTRIKHQADKKGYYTPPNIREDTSVNYVPKPPIEAINETLIKLANEPEAEDTITKMYASERERQQKNGLPVTIDRFEQKALFDDIKVRGVRDINKILDITTSLTIPAFYMLSGHLQELQRESGKQIEDLTIAEMSITEFMRINPRFNTAKARKKGIGKEHKEAAINSLDLLRRVQYPINRPIKKNGKTVGYELDSVKVYDYTLITDADKQITSIRNLQYSRDFLAKYNRILAVPYGEGFYTLTEITHQQLDITIQSMLTSKANIKRTAAGEPLIIAAKEFKKIYKDYSLSHFYRTLTNGLNKLADVNEISRWHTAAGGQEITSREPSSQTVYIYPAAIHEALITSDERKAIKMEQARRLRDLKSLITKYRKDLKQNKTSSTEYLKYLAEDLGITQAELTAMQANDEPINDDLWHKINELYHYL